MIRKTTLFASLWLFTNFQLDAQCTSVGPNNPTSAVNTTGIGTVAWGTPTNAITSNNVRTAAGAVIVGDNTNYLVVTGFNFAVPSTAIICGISVVVEKGGTGLFHAVNDNSVRIVKAGAITGSEHAIDNVWPGPDVNVTYGGAGDLWGTSWTPAEINAGNFGVAFSASLGGVAVLPFAHIDNIRVTIHFDNTLPIELISFNGIYNGETVNLTWEVASQMNNDFFSIERSIDGTTYETVGSIKGAGNSSELITYKVEDDRPLNGTVYYRLTQTDYNGIRQIFDPIAVVCKNYDGLVLSPNPATDKFTINFKHVETENYTLSIYNQSGKQVLQFVNLQNGQLIIDDPMLDNGIYVVQLRTENEIISTQRLIIAH